MIVIDWLLKAIKAITEFISSFGDNIDKYLIGIGVMVAIILSWLLRRFFKAIKDMIANLFTPSGLFFFLVSLIALIVFLIKFDIL